VRLEPVTVHPLLAEVAAEVDDAVVVVDCSDAVTVRAHRELLLQALENLTANARKHATHKLVFRARHVDAGRVRIDVADDGRGMTRHDAKRALDRFHRGDGSASDGFGLGLPIVREVVGAMNGTVSIESSPGRGTTVSVILQSADAPVEAPVDAARAPA
jgi:two-component system OmpR family sensor kinase